jgi:hypothetical protein
MSEEIKTGRIKALKDRGYGTGENLYYLIKAIPSLKQ